MSKADLLEQLAADARRLRVGQRLPSHGNLTPNQVQAVRNNLQLMLDQPGATLTKIAEALGDGFTRGTLARFLKADLNASAMVDQNRIARGVNTLLEMLARRNEARDPRGFVRTRAAQRMLAVIEKTIDLCAIGLIVGDAGRGKTMTLQAAKDIWPGTLLVRVRQAGRSPSGFARQLCQTLHLRGRSLTGPVMQGRIIDALHGTGRALLIDEAHQLRQPALELVRDIHDETGCPVVLCGTIRLADAVNDHDQFFGQFTSRVALRLDLTEHVVGTTTPGPGQLHSIDEIRQLYASDKVRFTDDGIELLTRIANLPGLGGLRLCQKLTQVAASAARASNQPAITADLLTQVIRVLQGQRHAAAGIERAIQQSRSRVA